MALKLNPKAVEHAKMLIAKDEVDHMHKNWQEEQPTKDEVDRYLNTHSLEELGLWYLAIDTDEDPKSMQKYRLPIGDFSLIYKSGIEAAQKSAKNTEIENAAKQLLGIIEKKK
ncbi:hypothetical protein M1446_04685 [Candidatus Dependentiae bacterium]|nr:hypothetical protein [Candidatus Dependentiae bacterium]